jgi:hypothetical protein
VTGPLEIARITIVKRFDDQADGGDTIHTTYSDGLGLADALGMLAFAQATTAHDYLHHTLDDDNPEDR